MNKEELIEEVKNLIETYEVCFDDYEDENSDNGIPDDMFFDFSEELVLNYDYFSAISIESVTEILNKFAKKRKPKREEICEGVSVDYYGSMIEELIKLEGNETSKKENEKKGQKLKEEIEAALRSASV